MVVRGRLAAVVAVIALCAGATAGAVGPVAAVEVEHWTLGYTAAGRVVDVTPDAVVYRNGATLHHVDATETDRTVTTAADPTWPARITPGGVVFLEPTGSDGQSRLRTWTPTAGASDLGVVPHQSFDEVFWAATTAVAVEGRWLAFGRLPGGPGPSGVVVRDLLSGSERLVSASVPSELDVADDGTVAFVVAGRLFLDRAGTTTALTPMATDTAIRGPRTDGSTTLFARVEGELEEFGDVVSSLVASDGIDETVLVAPAECQLVPLASGCRWLDGYPRAGTEYLVDRGVAAWFDVAIGRVVRRVGTGTPEVVFTSRAELREVGPSGELLLDRQYTQSGEMVWIDHPHLIHPDGTVAAVHAPYGSAASWAGPHLVAVRGSEVHLLQVPTDGSPEVWTAPDPTTAVVGGELALVAEIGGTPVPTITWERSVDGTDWVPLDPADSYQVEWDGDPYTSYLGTVLSGGDAAYRWYRAVGTNVHGSAATEPVEVAVGRTRIVPGQVSVSESASVAHLRITLSDPVTVPVTARWQTVEVPGLADQATPGVDHTPSGGIVTFSPRSTTAFVTIPLLGDDLDEADERIVVQVGDPTVAVMGGFWGIGVITVVDDD
jgi:hypothetical protein